MHNRQNVGKVLLKPDHETNNNDKKKLDEQE
jgi:hypothetical protein